MLKSILEYLNKYLKRGINKDIIILELPHSHKIQINIIY